MTEKRTSVFRRGLAVLSAITFIGFIVIVLIVSIVFVAESQRSLKRLVDADMAALIALHEHKRETDFKAALATQLQFDPLTAPDRLIGYRSGPEEAILGNLQAWPPLDLSTSQAQIVTLPESVGGSWYMRGTVLRDGAQLIVARNADVRMADLRQLIAIAAVALLLLGALMIATAAFLTRQVSGRVQRIATQCDAISTGDLTQRINQRGNDELSYISTQINNMVDSLQAALSHHKSAAAQIAHELKIPLARANARLSRELPPSYKTDIEQTQAELRSLAKTIDDVLEISALDARRADRSRFQDVALAGLMHQMQTLYDAAAEEADITLSFIVSPQELTISCNPASMRRLLANLLDNALRLTPAGGEIIVRSELIRGRFQLTVTDTGPGFPEGFKSLAFERFANRRADTAHAYTAGLGLAFVKAIATHHGWQVSAQNTGSGARVTVEAATDG